MSKADRLGAGASFGQTQTISARRAAINANTSAPTEGAPPPVKLPVDVISLNPDNPRSELGDLTDLSASLRDHGQKTAISIMGRFAYLEGNPGREGDLEQDTKYVVIDGNSRLAASREAGLTEIKVMLDDDLGSNPDEILESALVANIHRQDLDHLDEAKALEQLLKVHGTQEALAARLHRSQGWVSQRLALLTLTPQLKQRLQSGEESAALLRRVGKKRAEEQEEHLRLLKEKEAQEAADKKTRAEQRAASSRKQQTQTPPAEIPPTEKPSGPTANPAPSPDHYAVINGSASGETAGRDLPKPRDEAGAAGRLPSRDPEALSELIIAELDVPTRRKLTELLVDYNLEETKRM
ncbi:ParB/RepB/Spo0J family partition protein (plasmid) [Streptomyces sp. NBC_00841]|uniref:ParB/RepB/Spo0J family partition protein n=1 Tax=unclassified Streptomyces TaxID=2593676 RepID=UPI0022503471|nr:MULTISPECIES: ParB/RepB/Spo0J family partition protein [unclassified Streptomyces]MCX4538556.1 ParB/RepB/Spo0J family partition protein [Streptomyces sp. NBC_01669]WSA05618.1 ParB/RepB/Spo0J family partition protein [Streptomyces sp. NBC_00841]